MHTNWVTRVFCYENLSLPTAAYTRVYILKSSEKMTTLSFFLTFLPCLQMWCLPLNSYSILKVCSCWWNVMFYKQYIMTSFHWKNDNIYVRLYICSLVSRSLYSLLVVIVHIHKKKSSWHRCQMGSKKYISCMNHHWLFESKHITKKKIIWLY